MSSEPYSDLFSRLGELVEISSKASTLSGALRQVVELCQRTLASRACTIVRVDLDEKSLIPEACVGFDLEFERRYIGRKIMLDPNLEGAILSFDKVSRGVMVEAGNLQEQGNEYANPKTARQYDLRSMLSCPIKNGSRLFGYLTHFTSQEPRFSHRERTLLQLFAGQTLMLMEQFQARGARLRRNVVYTVYGGAEPPVADPELNQLLQLIAEQCAGVPGTAACLIHLWTEVTQRLELKAHFTTEGEFDLTPVKSLASGEGVIGQAARTGKAHSSAGTPDDQFAPESPKLCIPVRLYGQPLGTVTVVGLPGKAYGISEQRLLEDLVASIPVAIERAAFQDSFLRRAPKMAKSESVEELLRELVQLGCDWLHAPVCFVWLLNKNRNGYALESHVAPEALRVNKEELFLSNESSSLVSILKSKGPSYVEDASTLETHPLHAQALKLNLKSVLAGPIRCDDQNAGLIAVCSVGEGRQFTPWHKKLFAGLADQVEAALRSLSHISKLDRLLIHVQSMQKAQSNMELQKRTIAAGLDILETHWGCFRGFNVKNGELALGEAKPNPVQRFAINFGKGVTGRAIQNNEPIKIDDVLAEPWRDTYKALWPGQRSELAVPIIFPDAKIRRGRKKTTAPKLMGVLNFESPTVSAFTEFDQQCIIWLARNAARILERLEFDKKLDALRTTPRDIAAKGDWESIIQFVVEIITKTLGYDFVNISLITPDYGRIKTQYLTGLSDADKEEFMRMADHPLHSNGAQGEIDIQADIVNRKKVEVIDRADDPRLDQKIVKRFHHENLLRVYVPMLVATDDKVIGTVEAAIQKAGHERAHVYDRDVLILQQFVEYATLALEKKDTKRLVRASHELNAPLVALRNNASFLQRRMRELPDEKIQLKCNDILCDAELLQGQIINLELSLGRKPAAFNVPRRTVPISLYRDVISKTVNQIKPHARDYGLDPTRIRYDEESAFPRSTINIDPTKLNQVIFNLFTNALKYAGSPESFRIWITGSETEDSLFIKFKDWGIGIEEAGRKKVFEDGWRSPAAIAKGISGNGIGLTISKQLMLELGGDLVLANPRNPTEFHIILKKAWKGKSL